MELNVARSQNIYNFNSGDLQAGVLYDNEIGPLKIWFISREKTKDFVIEFSKNVTGDKPAAIDIRYSAAKQGLVLGRYPNPNPVINTGDVLIRNFFLQLLAGVERKDGLKAMKILDSDKKHGAAEQLVIDGSSCDHVVFNFKDGLRRRKSKSVSEPHYKVTCPAETKEGKALCHALERFGQSIKRISESTKKDEAVKQL